MKGITPLEPHHRRACCINARSFVFDDLKDRRAFLSLEGPSRSKPGAVLDTTLRQQFDFGKADHEQRRIIQVRREVKDFFNGLLDQNAALESRHLPTSRTACTCRRTQCSAAGGL